MIVKNVLIQECWCPVCNAGQMGAIHAMIMSDRSSNLIGTKVTCKSCGTENEITDVLEVIPTEFYVSSQNESSIWKCNDDLKKWLNED